MLLILAIFAAIVYVTIRVIEKRGDDPGKGVRPRPVAPDDDPEFLRHLDRKRRRGTDHDSS